jgi:hypothetical protein
VVLLGPHGGGLAGFVLVRGSSEQIAAVRERDDVNRLNVRAGLIVEEFGMIDAYLNEGLAKEVEVYREAAGELA